VTLDGGILRRDVGVAYNDVSVVTNISADHLSVDGSTPSTSSLKSGSHLEIRVRSQGNALSHEVSSQWLCCDPATARSAEVG
jgi:hypothetical protein